MIAAGTYRARVIALEDVQFGFTEGGKEQVAVAFQITVEPYVGQNMTWFGYFTEKTEETTLRALRACGWKGDLLTDMSGVTENEVDLVVEIETDPETGRQRSKVRWVNSLGGGKVKLQRTMTAGQIAAFAQRMKGQAIAQRSGTMQADKRAAAAATAQSATEHKVVEEVPF